MLQHTKLNFTITLFSFLRFSVCRVDKKLFICFLFLEVQSTQTDHLTAAAAVTVTQQSNAEVELDQFLRERAVSRDTDPLQWLRQNQAKVIHSFGKSYSAVLGAATK